MVLLNSDSNLSLLIIWIQKFVFFKSPTQHQIKPNSLLSLEVVYGVDGFKFVSPHLFDTNFGGPPPNHHTASVHGSLALAQSPLPLPTYLLSCLWVYRSHIYNISNLQTIAAPLASPTLAGQFSSHIYMASFPFHSL